MLLNVRFARSNVRFCTILHSLDFYKKPESFQKCGGVFICCLNEIEAFANILTVETK